MEGLLKIPCTSQSVAKLILPLVLSEIIFGGQAEPIIVPARQAGFIKIWRH